MNKAAWIIFGSVIVLIIGALVVYSRIKNPSVDIGSINSASIIAANDQNGQIGDRTFGNTESKVVLIEYGDFQCPSCGNAHPQIKEITETYKDRVLFIFRNFPLTTIHPNARASAAAVEAAGTLGKYWEMHNLIFENQNAWGTLVGQARTDKFAEYAVSIGLDRTKFLEALGSDNVNKKISFDQAIGKKLNVDATPTFFIGANKVTSETASSVVQGDSTKLKALLDAELAK